jgi:hypothetical protein
MDKPETFTIEEVNERIPVVQHHLEQIVRHRQRLLACYEALTDAGIDVEDSSDEDEGDADPVRLQKQTYKRCLMAIAQEIRSIESLGAFIKDLNLGLIDFYGEFDGRLIFFCWQFGETELLYWHDLEEGFSGRCRVYADRESSWH